MPRIRTIKPEMPQSVSMGRVSRDARLFFILTWTLMDDEGRSRGESRILASLLYPHDDDVDEAKIDIWVDELQRQACLIRYEDEEGHIFIASLNWDKHQKIDRPSKSKLPPPPHEKIRELRASVRENNRGAREASALDQGSRTMDQRTKDLDPDLPPDGGGARESPKPSKTKSQEPDGFELFWEAYPKKEDKGHARQAYARAIKTVAPETLFDGARRYARERRADVRPEAHRWTKNPATWINGECWNDEPAPPPTEAKPNGPPREKRHSEILSERQRNAMKRFMATGQWDEKREGPPPGQDGCMVPQSILREFEMA